jgi:DNA-binding LytR/AlgR family response regulator
MKCLIIDDDATARLIVRQLCEGFDNLTITEEFSNAIDAMKFLNADSTIDAIFLDIHMPSFSGFDFIKTLKSPPKIILTTSDRNFALDAFEYDCVVDYLVKPITKERFDKAIAKLKNFKMPAQQTANSENEVTDELYVNVDRRLVKISFNDINIIEAKGDYIKIKTNDKSHIVHSTLKKIEDKLPKETFLKVHRSYIINLSKIIDIEDNSVLIKQDIIPVSRSNRSELMKRLNLL